MKIGSIDSNKPVTPASGNAIAGSSGRQNAAAAPPEASAKLALSPAAASLVNEARADFDAEKVARIAQAIREGKFAINAEAIADKLIANAREELAGPQQ